ncbi:MAG: hypothetical protein ACREMN_12980 [Gemmatimonadales bacterium]
MPLDLARTIRNPKSAIRNCLLVLAACTPATTRPPYRPFPESLRAVINAPPARVTEEARDWLRAAEIPVRFASPRDAWLETAELPGNVTLRLWADPDVPGKARVIVEAVYRPVADPSRMARDLERFVPDESAGRQLADRLLAALVEKFGETTY